MNTSKLSLTASWVLFLLGFALCGTFLPISPAVGQTPDFAGALGHPEFGWNGFGWRVTTDGMDGPSVTGASGGGIGRPRAFFLLNATVVGPGELRFWWKSAPPFSFLPPTTRGSLAFSVDGVTKFSGFGDPATDWGQSIVPLAAGSHALQWMVSEGEIFWACDPPSGQYCPNGYWDSTPSPSFTIDAVTWLPARGFHRWIADRGLSGPDAEGRADPDGDGGENLLEYVFGTSPTDAGEIQRGELARVPHGVDFQFPLNPEATDVELIVEYSTTLGGLWVAAATRQADSTTWVENGFVTVDAASGAGTAIVRVLELTTPTFYIRLRTRLP